MLGQKRKSDVRITFVSHAYSNAMVKERGCSTYSESRNLGSLARFPSRVIVFACFCAGRVMYSVAH